MNKFSIPSGVFAILLIGSLTAFAAEKAGSSSSSVGRFCFDQGQFRSRQRTVGTRSRNGRRNESLPAARREKRPSLCRRQVRLAERRFAGSDFQTRSQIDEDGSIRIVMQRKVGRTWKSSKRSSRPPPNRAFSSKRFVCTIRATSRWKFPLSPAVSRKRFTTATPICPKSPSRVFATCPIAVIPKRANYATSRSRTFPKKNGGTAPCGARSTTARNRQSAARKAGRGTTAATRCSFPNTTPTTSNGRSWK